MGRRLSLSGINKILDRVIRIYFTTEPQSSLRLIFLFASGPLS